MYYVVNDNLNQEYIMSSSSHIKYCANFSSGECSPQCSEFSFCFHGDSTLFHGNIGSSLIKLTSINHPPIINVWEKYKNQDLFESEQKCLVWLYEAFEQIRSKDTDIWRVFLLFSPFSFFIEKRCRNFLSVFGHHDYDEDYDDDDYDDELDHNDIDDIQKNSNSATDKSAFELKKKIVEEHLVFFDRITHYFHNLDDDMYSLDYFKFACALYFNVFESTFSELEEAKQIEALEEWAHDFEYTRGLTDLISSIKNEYKAYSEEKASMRPRQLREYRVETLMDICALSFVEIIKKGYRIKKCENCSQLFIPYNRSDTIYCDRTSPQDDTLTCKEYGSKKLWYDKLRQNECAKLARNVHSRKQMLVRRNPDIKEYAIAFENYKKESAQWKIEVKNGLKTETQFLEWLSKVKSTKY